MSSVLCTVWQNQVWDQRLWDCIKALFDRLAPYIGETECTIIGDSAFGCSPMVKLCQKDGWGYLFRIGQHTCQHYSPEDKRSPSCAGATLVSQPGKRFYGAVRLWQDNHIETNLSAYYAPEE